MAKKEMLCPFSKALCKECPLYRGRHYNLCYCSQYRGCLESTGKEGEREPWRSGTGKQFDMPPPLPPSPKWLALNEFIERKEK